MKKFIPIFVIFLLPLMMVAGCSNQADVKKTLHVGISADYPPFEFTENREKGLKGFDIDLMRAIGKEMGYEVVFQDMGFDDLLGTLEKGNVDMVISAMSINEERKARVNFSDSYYESGMAIAVRRDNADIKSFTDLPGHRIAVALGTTSAFEMRELKSIELIELPNAQDAFHSLLSGYADAVVSDKPVVDYFLNTNDGINVKTLPTLLKKERFGIAVGKKNNELKGKIDDALQKIKEKGIYDKIYVKWFGNEGV
ncbi:MAG: basic amino acid ABC transporter substrate-binding protein [Selenomonadaceae bacterium]|nr:basic amino acid ABC transporter substrate-binding protein [Selenomonadaceae bacterium]MBP3723225.1 basic amino acid ABC transporter substrate-binding protein [Selenomonadaceae bacterium]